MFTAFTGATGVTLVALGAVLYPALRHAHYEERFSLGLLTVFGQPRLAAGAVDAADSVRRRRAAISHDAAGRHRRAVQGGLAAVFADGRRAVDLQRLAVARTAETRADERAEVWASIKGAAWELPLPFVVLARHLFGTTRRIGSGGRDRALRVDRDRVDSPRNQTDRTAARDSRGDDAGRRDSDRARLFARADELADRCGRARATVLGVAERHHQQVGISACC